MTQNLGISNAFEAKMRAAYGPFYGDHPSIDFNVKEVPLPLKHMIPYARFWGISDDLERERLIDRAPDKLKAALKRMIAENDDALDEWLAGSEASKPVQSGAYVAFSAMRLASDLM